MARSTCAIVVAITDQLCVMNTDFARAAGGVSDRIPSFH